MIGTASTYHSTESDLAPSSEIHVVSSDKGKSDKQPGSNKKGKAKKKKNSNPQEIPFDQSSRPRKPRYPCIISNEEIFVRDFPHHAKVSKIIKASHASAISTDPFQNLDTHLVAMDPSPTS